MTSPFPKAVPPAGPKAIPTAGTGKPGSARELHEAGRLAMARRAWPEGRDLLTVALEVEETPETLESLAVASFWSRDVGRAVEQRQRAYRLYLERGDRRSAARVATGVALDYEHYLGETAVASGWKERAARLLEEVEPCAEHAWLLLWKAHHAILFHNEVERGRALLEEAVETATRLGLADVALMARGLRGFTLVSEGRLVEGMRLLDETATAAIAGELTDPEARGSACCYVLSACENVLDLARAGQWQRQVIDRYVQDDEQLGLTFCRKHHIQLLVMQGEWVRAEAEIERFRADLPRELHTFVLEMTMTEGELRRRQGRRAEARALFDQEPAHPRAMLGRAALDLDEGRADAALRLVERYLRQLGDPVRTDHLPALWLTVRAAVAAASVERAAQAAATIATLAEALATDLMRAFAAAARGVVAGARGELEEARRELEQAVELFAKSGAPFETGWARLELARAQRSLGDGDAAALEARAALAQFTRLGAVDGVEQARLELDRGGAASLASPLGKPLAEAAATTLPLSDRELEVLRLLAQGLSNAEIGKRLFLSAHTVKRHVANILGKLDLPSRAAAAAVAVRSGLT
jgi:LuxR family transcriptional regulator, maltose regulon positive regulatory protein